MNTITMIVGGIIIVLILLAIVKKVIKTILGLILIVALILGGIYIYNTYPKDVKDLTDNLSKIVDKTTVKDYLRVDNNNRYYVYVESRDAEGRIIYPTGQVFDYPDASIDVEKIIDLTKGNFKGFKKQYYRIDKKGEPIVPRGVKAPRKFLQLKLGK